MMISSKIDITEEKKRFPKLKDSEIIEAKRYYEMGLVAEHIHQQPGCPGRQATQRLVNFWNGKIIEERNSSLEERQIITMSRMADICSDILFKLNYALGNIEQEVEEKRKAHLDKMEKYRQKGKTDKIRPFENNIKLEHLRLSIMKEIIHTASLVQTFQMMPTSYEMHRDQIKKQLMEIHEQANKEYNRSFSN